MRDNILLLIAGVVCAVLAWCFFHYFQNYAFTILLLIVALGAIAKPSASKFGHKKNKT